MSQKVDAATVCLAVRGMHCEGCVSAIGQALQEQDGVLEHQVSLPESTATVTYNPTKVTPAQLVALIDDLGYQASPKP